MKLFNSYTDSETLKLNLVFDRLPFSFNPVFSDVLAKQRIGQFHLIETQDGEIVFPVILRKGKILKFLEFLNPPLRKNGEVIDMDKEREILDQFVSFLTAEKIADRVLQPLNWCLFQSYPKGSTYASFGTYRLNLKKKTEEIFAGLHAKHRNVIRNAESKAASIVVGTDAFEDFYKLYVETMNRSEMSAEPKWYFLGLLQKYSTNIFCGLVSHNSVPQGAVFVPFTKSGAYYVYGASAGNISLTGAVNYLHYEMMRHFQAIGVGYYDMVGARLSDVTGTKLEGIQKFKSRFGGELIKGFLWKMDINKTKCKIFDTALFAKQKMKGKKMPLDIIDQERKKN